MSTRKKVETKVEAEQMVEQQKREMEPIVATEAAAPLSSAVTTSLTVQQPAGALEILAAADIEIGEGHEERRKEDTQIPMLLVLQALSPACQPDGIPGARPGLLINSLTKQVYDPTNQDIRLVLGYYYTRFVKWVPREKGGGFLGEFPMDDQEMIMAQEAARAANGGKMVAKIPLADGNEAYETLMMYGALIVDGVVEPIAIPCKSTQLKPARSMTQQLYGFKLIPSQKKPCASSMFVYKIGTVPEKRAKGTSFNYRFTLPRAKGVGPVWDKAAGGLVMKETTGLAANMLEAGDEGRMVAKSLYEGVTGGLMKAAHESAQREDDAAAGTEETPF